MQNKTIPIVTCKLVHEADVTYASVTSPSEAEAVLRAYGLADFADERAVVVFLAADGSVTGLSEVGRGDITSCIMSPHSIFRNALLACANRIIIAHNHPSGQAEPSAQDIATTQRLREAGDIIGIKLVDHLILTVTETFSFSEHGL